MANNPIFASFNQISKAGKIAAIYIRVSRNEFKKGPDGEEEQRQSVKNQKGDAIELCKREGWKYKIYDDCEMSGITVAGKEGEGRVELQEMLDDVKEHRIHTVIIRDIKRLARNARHLKEIIHDFLIPNGVILKGLSQPLDITTPEGRVFVSMLAEFAEMEIYNTRDISMRNNGSNIF